MKFPISVALGAGIILFASVAIAGEMPKDILADVKSSIESRYPDDFSMQKTLIDDQVQSYKFLQDYSPSNVPSDVFQNLKVSIEKRYPYDFSMQKTLLKDQVQSYEFLKDYEPSSIPLNVLEKIKNKISLRYPYDFSMQKVLKRNCYYFVRCSSRG